MAKCGNPENPGNGTCTAAKTTYGGKKTCSCNHGYRLSDPSSATTTCQIENFKAKWIGPTPSCQCTVTILTNDIHDIVCPENLFVPFVFSGNMR